MYCRRSDGVLIDLSAGKYRNCSGRSVVSTSSICGGWKYFLANCPRTNMMCSGLSGAWVPAITVCAQSLY